MAEIRKEYDIMFDNPNGERPWMVYPKIFGDNRGFFTEVLAGDDMKCIKQINRSSSCQMAIRGLHAQTGAHCQSKIVEALTIPIYDIIVDARPDSKTFGQFGIYLLDPIKQNKLYVPHGFLHSFAVPKHESGQNAVFMYYCDETYCKESEMHVNPMTVLSQLKNILKDSSEHESLMQMLNDEENLVLSDKDLNSEDYYKRMERILFDYAKGHRLWYKA